MIGKEELSIPRQALVSHENHKWLHLMVLELWTVNSSKLMANAFSMGGVSLNFFGPKAQHILCLV